MNQYSNFLRFVPLTGTPRSLDAPTSLSCLPARPGDHFRLLIPRTDLAGLLPELCKVVLIRENKGEPGYEILEDIGTIRPQQSELYTFLRLLVNDLPTADSYRQFALLRENGKQVIGTFRGQQTELSKYMQALKEFFEGYPYAPVLGEVNGNVLSLRIFRTGRFRLTDEPLRVGLGTVLESNENSPSLLARPLNTINQAAQTRYKIRVGKDVQPGNIFKLNGQSYTAVVGDTSESILQVLNGGLDTLTIESGTLGETQALAGERTFQNTTKPTVVAQWISNNGTYDYWKVKVQGDWQSGNSIQITAEGRTSLTRTVADSDTVTTLEAALNPNSGQYRTNSGVVPVITVLAGTQKVPNTNYPTLTALSEAEIPPQLMRRWQISVSPDVLPGNIYTLEEESYTAQLGDDAASVAQALGLTGAYSVITRPDGQPVTAYAKRGDRYNASHIADVQILEGPLMRRSRQVVLEVTLPEDYTGSYQLGLVDLRDNALKAVSNYLNVGSHEQDCLVEVLAPNEVFGYEYHEPGLSQRLRLPVSLGTVQPFLESVTQRGLDGYQRKRAVNITKTVELVSDPISEAFCDTLTAWLQHEEVVIDGVEYSMRDGMDTTILSAASKRLQFSARLTVSGQIRHNRGRYLSGVQLGFGRLEWLPPTHGVQLYLLRPDGAILPVVREMSLRAGEYQLEVIGAADVSVVEVFVNGESSACFRAPKQVRSRPSTLIRIEPHGLTSLRLVPAQEEYVEETCLVQIQPEAVAYSCEIVRKDVVGEFSDDWGEDFAIKDEKYRSEFSDDWSEDFAI
ncbi:hypothetical protein [Telluribacter humicola]|uniref:hypothetical protein n=1 Tax=Telluribacter humicola TaxID=1720261 RepID=UPI001A95BE8E|nr:hypothetical protein [Telluribacter humicola]